MAASERRPRKGPAPIASFDHDVSDESSPETKQSARLPEIREGSSGSALAPPAEGRARSHSSPGLGAVAPRIDISRASSSSHHDSRDSSPELALFAGAGDAADSLGFREDGAADLRSSTEELAFLEPTPTPAPVPPTTTTTVVSTVPTTAAPAPPSRRHSRKDSQGSEVALLGISGRTSRLSSVGSQCSAQSALSALSHASHTSRVSHLSVVSGVSRSPSPHKMLLETSFCGPKPIETDPEICTAAVEEHLLEIAKLQAFPAVPTPPAQAADARDRREVRTEATVEPRPARPAPVPAPTPEPTATAPPPPAVAVTPPADEKRQKESRNRRARSRERRDHSQPEVYKSRNRSKDIIRIKLKPDEDSDDDDEESELCGGVNAARKPESLALSGSAERSGRSPSPAPAPTSRKSSFCSLFKSRETIASPDSPSDVFRRKKSLTDGRSRSKSRDRSAPPSASGKLRGSVLSLFKTPRRSAASPSPSSRAASPGPAPASVPPPPSMRGLKYYEEARDGIIHIPLRTPPDETPGSQEEPRETVRPASAPCRTTSTSASAPAPALPTRRTVLPDGSIIIPLHSPTERQPPPAALQQVTVVESQSAAQELPSSRAQPPAASAPETGPQPRRSDRPEPEPPPPPSKVTSPELVPSLSQAAASASPVTPVSPASPAERVSTESTRIRRKERLVFTTHVGSTEQVFSTQFSITKTPSVTSEISESVPSLQEVLRDTHIAGDAGSVGSPGATRDSSESESSEAGTARGSEAEARGLVVQESFEEELPYVPTTLPQERSLALPMLPVRDRGPQLQTTASVERPRSAVRGSSGPLAPPPPPARSAAPAPQERLRIRLPRRASTTGASTLATSTMRTRTKSGSDGAGEVRKAEWIDFTEVPERRKAARRIQTLPARAAGVVTDSGTGAHAGAEADGVSYVEPDQCRCECHRSGSPAANTPSPTDREAGAGETRAAGGAPFLADLDVREDAHS